MLTRSAVLRLLPAPALLLVRNPCDRPGEGGS